MATSGVIGLARTAYDRSTWRSSMPLRVCCVASTAASRATALRVVYREYTTKFTIWIDCMAARRRRNQSQRLDTNAGHASASSRAYDAIRQRILRCKLEPGALINERALMEQISIGRTPIREALLRLSAEQLVIFSGQ